MVGVGGRSKGCKTCRQRRVKCDEEKPACRRCVKGGFECLGYAREIQWRHTFPAPFPEPSSSQTSTPTSLVEAQNRRKSRAVVPIIRSHLGGAAPSIPHELDLSGFNEDFYFGFMFSNFVWRGYGSQWLTQAAQGKLDRLALDSARALAQSTFGKFKRVAGIEIQGSILYGKCLQDMVHKLANSHGLEVERGHELIIPILILMMHASTSSNRDAALFHLKGVTSILAACDPCLFQRQPFRNALEAARAPIIISSLITQKRTFLEEIRWHHVPYCLEPINKEPQSYLVDILSAVPGFLEDALYLQSLEKLSPSTSQGSPSPSISSTQPSTPDLLPIHIVSQTCSTKLEGTQNTRLALLDRVKKSLVLLYRWRWHWQTQFGRYVHLAEDPTPLNTNTNEHNSGPKQPSIHPKRLEFSHSSAAADMLLYNAVLMWLLALLWDLEPFHAGTLVEQCAEEARKIVMGLTKKVVYPKYNFGQTSPGLSRYTSFEPLRRPGAALFVRDPAVEICRIFEWQSQNHNAINEANFFYMFPIGMAIALLNTEPECREWIRSLLDMNEYTRGYGGYFFHRQREHMVPTSARNSKGDTQHTSGVLGAETQCDNTGNDGVRFHQGEIHPDRPGYPQQAASGRGYASDSKPTGGLACYIARELYELYQFWWFWRNNNN